MPPFEISKKGLLRSFFQVAAIYSMLTVLENVQVVLFSKKGMTYNFFKTAKKMFCEEACGILKSVGLLDQINIAEEKFLMGIERV
jgi:branched-chain amino acid transport system ATP-binding protein